MNSGEASPATGVRLTPRDREILTGHFPAYRITTHEALRRARWPDAEIDAVKKWTLRMRELSHIAEADLWAPSMVYFRLTPDAVAQFGLPAHLGRALTPFQLARAYGVLSFCLLGPIPFRKLTAAEFRARFRELVNEKLEDEYYYLDTDFHDETWPKDKRLGYVYVDSGKRVRDVVRRCEEVLAQRQRHDRWYHDVVRPGRFIYTIVTTDVGKSRQILEDLSPLRRKVPIRVEVRRDLMDVIPQRRRDASQRSDDT